MEFVHPVNKTIITHTSIKSWIGTPTQIDTPHKIKTPQEFDTPQIDGIPICEDESFNLGDIENKKSASVIFRLDKRESEYTYMNYTVCSSINHSNAISCKEIKKMGYFDIKVTYKHQGWLAEQGSFNVPITFEIHHADDRIEKRTVHITGNVK